MHTESELQNMTKETLLQFIDSFYQEKGRKYSLSSVAPKHKSKSYYESQRKQQIIEWILKYQDLHQDDPITFVAVMNNVDAQNLRRLKIRELMTLCVEKGFTLGTSFYSKDDYVEVLMGGNPFSHPLHTLTFEQQKEFLKVLKNNSLSKYAFQKKLVELRVKYNIH